jgi:steroid delta-isomerase-like uncharacterized protein
MMDFSNDVPAHGDRSPAQVIADLIAAWNNHDLEWATSLFAADYEGRDVAQVEPQHGRAGIRLALARYFEAMPDVHFALDDLIVTRERAVAVWTATGTHLGALMNIPASGRNVAVRGVSTFTLRDGQILHATYIWDVAGLLRSIGLLPDL